MPTVCSPCCLVVIVNGLQRFRLLRQDDDLLPSDDAPPTARQFSELLAGGPEVGILIIISLDTFTAPLRPEGRRRRALPSLRLAERGLPRGAAGLIATKTPKTLTLALLEPPPDGG